MIKFLDKIYSDSNAEPAFTERWQEIENFYVEALLEERRGQLFLELWGDQMELSL